MSEAFLDPDTGSSKICRVCCVPIRFTRLGVHACRACAAFYKRSKIARKRFVCRQGDGQCVFRKSDKFACRSCRFDKCTELGMEYSPAERKNDDTITDEEDANEPSTSANQATTSLLESMKVAYENSYEKRMAHELEVVKRHRLKRMEHPTEEFYTSNVHSWNDMFPTIIRETIDIFEQVFPFLKELIIEDKAAIFQDFVGKFSIIEGFYRTFMFIEARYFFATLITCIDCEDIDQWIRDEDFVERKADFRGLFRGYVEQYTEFIMPSFAIEKLSQQEFFALLIIGFCDIDLSLDLPDFIFDKLASIRTQIFAELQDYYKNEEMLVDVSIRMGKLMTVAHSTSEAGLLMNEEYRTYSALFDICSGDFLLREIFFQ